MALTEEEYIRLLTNDGASWSADEIERILALDEGEMWVIIQ